MKKANLYAAILIPLFMIVVTVLGILWHQKGLQIDNDFLYLASENYEAFYCVEQIKFELLPAQPKPKAMRPDCSKIQFYIYSFKTKTSTPITRKEVAQLKLSTTSPDQYRIEPYAGGGADFIWPFFGGNYYPDFSLSKGEYSKRLNIQQDSLYKNYYSLQFIAWIENPTPHH
jgi:hypothetical protein